MAETSNTEHRTLNIEGAGAKCVKLPAEPKTFVHVGGIAISRLDNGQLWMLHCRGEGAVVNEARLFKVLEEFFWREF